jgi:hypothetical protein
MSNPIRDEPRPVDEPVEAHVDAVVAANDDVVTKAGFEGGTVELLTVTLGLDPYVLIRAFKAKPDDEDDDGLRLKVNHNAQGAALAALYLLNMPAETNPITAAIKAVLDANGEHPDYQVMVETLSLFAEFCDVPMPESGR